MTQPGTAPPTPANVETSALVDVLDQIGMPRVQALAANDRFGHLAGLREKLLPSRCHRALCE